MASLTCDLFKLAGKSCVQMSLDDFYLTGQQQEQLSKSYPKNGLLKYRGNGKRAPHILFRLVRYLFNLMITKCC